MIKRVSKRYSKSRVLGQMLPLVGEWFDSKFDELTDPQAFAVPIIHARESVLISSPTGSGKTLTAFLSIINELLIKQEKGELEDKIYCVYISPLKALANDIDKNLKQPLKELGELAEEKGVDAPKIRVAVRSGDTTSYERQKMARKPPHILITTPESLAIILSTPKFSLALHSAEWLIVDEIHEICSSKRGVLLSVNLERLQGRLDREPVRIGLSATQAPIDEMAKFLSGYHGRKQRDVNLVEVETGKQIELRVVTPVEDMTALPFEIINARMYDTLKERIDRHTTTLVFTNTRSGTEAVVMKLSELGVEDIAAHHGSLSREIRLDVEDRLKRGELKAVVSSTSLELGIDIGSIDMMCQIGSPKSIAKGLQRVGRSGHGVGEVSRGRLIAFDNDDLVECAVLAKKATENYIDRVDLPRNSLDVLSQTIVGMSLEKVWDADEAFSLIRNSYSFHTLEKQDFVAVLDYLSSRDMPHVYSKIWHDLDENVFGRKRGSRLIYYLNSGTIPEEANYKVYSDTAGRLGELSERFVEKLSPGDVFVLGGSAYEFARAKGMSLFVKPATGKRPTVPSWTGEMLPRSFDLSVEIGRFRARMKQLIEKGDVDAEAWLRKEYLLDVGGARSIASYFHEQLEFNGQIPTDKHLVLEGYIDPKGNLNVVFHFCFGRRTNDALARAYAMAVSNKHKCNVSVSVNDDCFMLTLPKRVKLEGLEKLVTAKNIVDLLEEAIRDTELFKHRFRHCSTRGFMVLRNYKGRDVPVGRQHQRSQKVLRAIGERHDFPIIKETMSEIMNQNMNIQGASSVLRGMEDGTIQVSHAGITDIPSPFAHNVILVGMSDIVLMHDRSALLKELHRKVLLRVGGKDSLRPEFVMEKVREHFQQKRPVIMNKEDIVTTLAEVGPLELFSRKGNSIYDLSDLAEEELAGWCNELIDSHELVSVWAGRNTWVATGELERFAGTYGSDSGPDEAGTKVLELLKDADTPLSTTAIAKELELESRDVRRTLGTLERAYNVARAGQGKRGNLLWTHREVKKRGSKAFERDMVRRHLAYFAPMTVDELAYELGHTKEHVSGILEQMQEKGTLSSGAFTEPTLQYMLARDRAELRGESSEGIVSVDQVGSHHLEKHFSDFESIDQYFDRYGVVWMPQDLIARAGIGVYKEWVARRKKGDILHGRFLDEGVGYVRRKDAHFYVNAYRSERLDSPEKQILRIIEREPGIDITGIAKESELPRSKAKSIVDKLDRNMHVVRRFVDREGWSSWNRYEKLEVRYQPGRKEQAAERIIMQTLRAYAPMPLRSLVYATGFSVNRVKSVTDNALKKGTVKEVKTAEDGRTLLVPADEVKALKTGGTGREQEGRLRVLTLYDPVVQHHRYELRRRFGDSWYFPLLLGSGVVGMLEMWEMSGCMDIRDIVLDDVNLLPELLDALDEFSEFYAKNLMDVIRVKGAFGKPVDELKSDIIHVFESKGYQRVNDWLVKGSIITMTVNEEQLFPYLLWKQHVLPGRKFPGMEEGLRTMGGFRSDEEGALRCQRFVPLKKLFRTGVVEMGQLIPKLLTYALADDILLYKSALGVRPDPYMNDLISMFAEEGTLKWREIIDNSPLGYYNTMEAKNRLTSALLILRNADNEYYLTRDSPYKRQHARKEVVRRMFHQFGIFSAEHLSMYTKGEYRMSELRRILRELEEEGMLVKGYLLEGSDKLHWMVKKDIEIIRDVIQESDVLLTSNDRLAFYLLPWVNQKFGIGSSWLVLSNGKLTAAAKVRKRKAGIMVQEFAGDRAAWDIIIKEQTIKMGLRLLKDTGSREEEEDYQEWYEKHMLPQKRKR